MKENDSGTLKIPKKTININKKDINYPYKIKNLILNEGLLTIGNSTFAFQNINKLKLPNSIKRIGAYAFINNPLEELILNEGLEWIGPEAFSECNLKTITIPKTISHIGINAFQGNKLEKVIFDIYSPYTLEYEDTLHDIFGDKVIFENQDLNQYTLKKKK